MQEAKYCEDIVPAIKQSLEIAGYTNEHDRLGHFESRVPADTFFGLASNHSAVRVFGFQFKAPSDRLQWDLTHTRGQFDTIRLGWANVIYYALPWYKDLAESHRGIDLCAFVDSTNFPDEPCRITAGALPIPDEYLARLLTCCSEDYLRLLWDGDSSDQDEPLHCIYAMACQRGPAEVIRHCIAAVHKDALDSESNVEIPLQFARRIAAHFRERRWQYISDWNYSGDDCNSMGLFGDCMAAKVILRVHFQDTEKPLQFSQGVKVEKFEHSCSRVHLESKGFTGMVPLDNMLQLDGSTPFMTWSDVLSRVQGGTFGIELNGLNLNEFRSQFAEMFRDDEAGLLVWYSHVERIFYAIESKRLSAVGSDGTLGFLHDPLIASLLPEMRTGLAKAAKMLGISPSDLLRRIVRVFLHSRDE